MKHRPLLPIPIGRINSSPTLSPNVQHNQTPPDVQINNCTQRGFCANKPLNPYSHTAVRSAPWKLCLVSNRTEWKRGNLKVTDSHRLFDCFFLQLLLFCGKLRATQYRHNLLSQGQNRRQKCLKIHAGATVGPLLIGQRNPDASCQADVT